MPPKDVDKELAAALLGLDKEYGKGTVRKLGDEPLEDVAVISTGSIALDEALGVNGVPRGRIIELFGPESSGKTTIALTTVAQAQKAGGRAAFVDAEHALDPEWAATCGVDVDDLYLSQPDNGEQAMNVASTLAGTGAFAVIVVDSVSALVPKAEIEGNIGDSHVGLQARLMSQGLRVLAGQLSQTKTTCIFINQLREKVGVLFGSPETTSGGRALKFYATMRLDVRRIETLKDGTEAIGNRVRVKAVKNKVAAPFRTAEVDLMFGEGISREAELIDLGVARGVVKKAGAWYTYEGGQLGQGKEKARLLLVEQPGLAAEIEAKVRAARPAKPTPPPRGKITSEGGGPLG